jgi:uncharacterized membrane protein YeaQ/YmgE (transglycosylase-associated protein family)
MVLSLLVWLVFGLIVGVIAKFLMPGKDPGGFLVTIVIGIVGSFIGGGVSWLLLGANDPYNPSGWIMSIVGALILLWVYRLIKSRSA